MRSSNYLTEEMQEAIVSYWVDDITPSEVQVHIYRVRPRAWDMRSHHAYVTFTPEGIAVMGPLVCGLRGRGILSPPNRGLAWFVKPHPAEDLLEAFLDLTWQVEVAEQDLRDLASRTGDHAEILLAAADAVAASADAEFVRDLLFRLGFDQDLVDEVGFDYPRDDAGWILAIHKIFLHFFN